MRFDKRIVWLAQYQPQLLGLLTQIAESGEYPDIEGLPTLAPVAISGQYDDLSGKPSPETTAFPDTTQLLNRANHTGSQAISSVDGLQTALDAKAPIVHVGSGDSAHALATDSIAGFISPEDKAKLNLSGLGQPSLYLDFQSEMYQQRSGYIWTATNFQNVIDFSRISGSGRFKADGLFEWIDNNNTPRFNYDPVSLSAKGLLIEGQATNQVLRSDEFNSWTASAVTVSPNVALGINGSNTADLVIPSTASAQHYLFRALNSVIQGESYVLKIRAKAAGYDYIAFGLSASQVTGGPAGVINLNTGIVTAQSGSGATITTKMLANGWCEIAIKVTASTTTLNAIWKICNIPNPVNPSNPSFAGDGTSGILLSAAEGMRAFEDSSYIPTTSSLITRSPEYVNLHIGDWKTLIIDHDAPLGSPLLSSGSDTLLISAGPGRSVLAWDETSIYQSNLGSTYVTSPNSGVSLEFKLLRDGMDTTWANAHVSKLIAFSRKLNVIEAMAV